MIKSKGADFINRKIFINAIVSLLLLSTFVFTFTANATTIVEDVSIQSPRQVVGQLNTDDTEEMQKVLSYVNVDKVTYNSAHLSWNVDSLFEKYIVYQYDFLADCWNEYSSSFTSEVTVENLLPDTLYKFKVCKADNISVIVENDESSRIGEVSFITADQNTVLTLLDVNYKSANICWLSEIPPSKYKIYRADGKNADYKLIKTVKGNVTSFIDKKLDKNVYYQYKIENVFVSNDKKSQSKYSNIITAKTTTKMKLPHVSGKCKTYAYYTAVTAKSSPAYAVLNSGVYNGVKYNTYTDEETGIRMVDDCYCAALGTYYGTTKGTKYRITLDTGVQFNIILCDTKSDRHTNSTHRYSKKNKDIVEFYVEKSKIPSNVDGNYNVLDKFNGKITMIEKL